MLSKKPITIILEEPEIVVVAPTATGEDNFISSQSASWPEVCVAESEFSTCVPSCTSLLAAGGCEASVAHGQQHDPHDRAA